MKSDLLIRQSVAASCLIVLGTLSGAWLIAQHGSGLAWAAEQSAGVTIQDNMDVGMEYTLTVDGAVVDSTEGRGPFHYIQGRKRIVPGLERQLAGLHVGVTKEVRVAPEDGYGPVDPAAFVEIPKTQLPPGTTPEVGMTLHGVSKDGRRFSATIAEVKAQDVKLNLNHPLAGKTLVFKVKILTISPATDKT